LADNRAIPKVEIVLFIETFTPSAGFAGTFPEKAGKENLDF
jgi:hypothetical protein